MRTATLAIAGMHCDSCCVLIESACKEFPSVHSCAIDFDKGTAVIEHDNADLEGLTKEIEALGDYKIENIS